MCGASGDTVSADGQQSWEILSAVDFFHLIFFTPLPHSWQHWNGKGLLEKQCGSYASYGGAVPLGATSFQLKKTDEERSA